MATDGPTPPPCDPRIFQDGKPVAILDARSNAAERWVKAVAARAQAQVDWHYSGGIAQVLHLGDDKSRDRVMRAIQELAGSLDGTLMKSDFGPNDGGLYREDVTLMPPGAIAAYYEGGTSSTFMQKEP